MRCNRTQAFSLAEENMPPLAFLTACRQHTQKGLAKTGPLRRFFCGFTCKTFCLIRLTRAISHHRR